MLADSAFGVVVYAAEKLAKSSVFAAYCAHGVCPVLISPDCSKADGLESGNHYVAGIPLESIGEAERQKIGRAAWEWYQPHGTRSHAATLERLIEWTGTGARDSDIQLGYPPVDHPTSGGGTTHSSLR